MRHRIILSLALILGLIPALNTTPLLARQDAQQQATPQVEGCEPVREVTVGGKTFEFKLDCDSIFAEGLRVIPEPESAAADQFEVIQFIGEGEDESKPGTGAYIPERFNPQAMVVKVLDGQFAFRTQGPGVIVDPQGQPLESVRAVTPDEDSKPNPIGLGENPNAGRPRTYVDDDPFPCYPPRHGHTLCELDPAYFESGERFVRLDPGDTVFLPDNSTCFLCNTGQIDPTTGEIVDSGGNPAELLIWTLPTGFNGELESIPAAMATPSSGTPIAQGSGRILGWAFNPASSCKG